MKSYLSLLPAIVHRPVTVSFPARYEWTTPLRPAVVADADRLYSRGPVWQGAIEKIDRASRSGIAIALVAPIASFLFREIPDPHAISESVPLVAGVWVNDDRSDPVTHDPLP